jgi:hypothetical protein
MIKNKLNLYEKKMNMTSLTNGISSKKKAACDVWNTYIDWIPEMGCARKHPSVVENC